MNAFWIALGLLCSSYFSRAQQYIIRYDLAGENINYYRIKKPGDTVATPLIKLARSSRVNLQLVNAANSYQRRITYLEKVEIQEKIVIPGIGAAPANNLVNGMVNVDLESLKSPDLNTEKSRKNEVEALGESGRQLAAKQAFASRYNEFAAAWQQWQKTMLFEQECQLLWKDLAGLRYSMQYPATEVKQTAKKKTEAVFPGAGENPSVILLNNNAGNKQSAYTAVKNSYTELLAAYTSLRDLEVRSAPADSLMKGAQGNAEIVARNYKTGNPQVADAIADRISSLFRQILNDSYTNTTPLVINRRTTMARISFIPEIDSLTAAALHYKQDDTIQRLVPIYKKEPLRFRNTFGFGFVTFDESRWNYYISPDSVIQKESANQFRPVVATYLHFYAPGDRGFRWGGTFGAGLPLTGDKNINIMLGLSTFLGKNDPVCITAGVAGAQVKKLSGWKEGDKVNFSELQDKNYQSVYRIGYFLALTFNPASLNVKD